MQFPKHDYSPNGLQLQPEAMLFMSSLLNLPDPTAFLTKYVEALYINRQMRQEQAEAELAHRQALAEVEAKSCNRLIAIILEHAKSQGVSPNNLPNLKRKNYEQLCAYVNESWAELNTLI